MGEPRKMNSFTYLIVNVDSIFQHILGYTACMHCTDAACCYRCRM